MRYVLAKSVGWGWLGYHAFLAGTRLAGFVPPVLGLRDGILYMEWVPDSGRGLDRAARIDAAAAYIAARVRHLSLARETAAGLDPPRQGNGARLLREQLGKAYGPFPINLLMQPRLGRLLRKLAARSRLSSTAICSATNGSTARPGRSKPITSTTALAKRN